MSIKHPNSPDMESDHLDSGVPGLFSSELPGLPLRGASSLGSRRGPQTLLQPHLTSCIALTWGLGNGCCCTWPLSTPGYAITQKLPAVPKPHTEFPNRTCENRSPVAPSATFGNCPVHSAPAGSRGPDAPQPRCEGSLGRHCL